MIGKLFCVMLCLLAILALGLSGVRAEEKVATNPNQSLSRPDSKPADMAAPVKVSTLAGQSSMVGVGKIVGEPLYTCDGNDLSFAAVQESSGSKPGERFNRGGAPGSRIHVNHKLLEQQVGKIGPIPKEISIHTEFSGAISRKDFGQWTRWYQEDGNVQVFRLFKGEQNIRNGDAKDGSPGRVEAYITHALAVAQGTWHEYEATYTVIKPVKACIFQLMHGGQNGQDGAILWPFHIEMSEKGDISFLRRRPVPGMEREIVMAENMVGKSLSVKVRANGEDYEVYQKAPLDDGPWKLVTKGSYTKAKETISFRWGMYCGSKKGQAVPNDAMLFVTGVKIR